MTRKVSTFTVPEGSDLLLGVSSAFRSFRDHAASDGVIVFSPTIRPALDLVEIICDQLEQNSNITSLTLVHPSPAMGFMSSSISLRARNVTIRSLRELHEEPVRMVSQKPASIARFVVIELEGDKSQEAGIRKAFGELRDRGSRACAIVFAATSRPTSRDADVVVDELLQSAGIGAIALVHKSASLGFLASSIRLRVPNVHVCAVAELSLVDQALRSGRNS